MNRIKNKNIKRNRNKIQEQSLTPKAKILNKLNLDTKKKITLKKLITIFVIIELITTLSIIYLILIIKRTIKEKSNPIYLCLNALILRIVLSLNLQNKIRSSILSLYWLILFVGGLLIIIILISRINPRYNVSRKNIIFNIILSLSVVIIIRIEIKNLIRSPKKVEILKIITNKERLIVFSIFIITIYFLRCYWIWKVDKRLIRYYMWFKIKNL